MQQDLSSTMVAPLKGKALLNKVKTIPTLSKEEKAKACGYLKHKGDKTRVNLLAFMTALLEAEGINLQEDSRNTKGRVPTYKASVQANGNLIIGKSYTKEMGLSPGDQFDIKIGYKHIHLVKIEPAAVKAIK